MKKQFTVQNYELQSDKVVAYLSDGTTDVQYGIDRQTFENWLTDGKGEYDASFTHSGGMGEITDVALTMSLDQYWQDGKEINNSPVLEHIHMYLNHSKTIATDVEQLFKYQALSDLLDMELDDKFLRLKIKAMVLDYGVASRQLIINQVAANAA